jgi:hypothetical protein
VPDSGVRCADVIPRQLGQESRHAAPPRVPESARERPQSPLCASLPAAGGARRTRSGLTLHNSSSAHALDTCAPLDQRQMRSRMPPATTLDACARDRDQGSVDLEAALGSVDRAPGVRPNQPCFPLRLLQPLHQLHPLRPPHAGQRQPCSRLRLLPSLQAQTFKLQAALQLPSPTFRTSPSRRVGSGSQRWM